MQMMKMVLATIVIFLSLAPVTTGAHAENTLSPEMEKKLAEFIQQRQGISLCLSGEPRAPDVWPDIINFMQRIGLPEKYFDTYWQVAMWKFYPCPFSPWRDEVAPLWPDDLKGAWIIPPGSHALQFGPKSKRKPRAGDEACDVFGYFEGQEARHLNLMGSIGCPFTRAQDIEFLRKNPVVMRWEFLSPGRLKIERSDVSNPREEWDVLKVLQPFTFNGVRFLAGDLIAYLRIEAGGVPEESMQFRHLRRLP